MPSVRHSILPLLAIAIVGVGLWLALLDEGQHPAPESVESLATPVVVDKAHAARVVPANRGTPTTFGPGAQEPVSLPRTPAEHVPMMPTTSETPLPKEKVPDAAIQDSGAEQIGTEAASPIREFPISRSVLEACEQIENGTCANEVMDLVKTMNDEAEGQTWSTQAEERLRRFLSADERLLEIRAVECRKTICAIEVSSAYGPIYGSISSDNWLDANLQLWNGLNGYERDETGGRITVSLRTYRRR